MDLEEYRKAFVVDPAPEPRFGFSGFGGVTIFFTDYEAAVAYYSGVLGPPGYVEGTGTRAWRIGPTWLTLLAGGDGAPRNTEVMLLMDSPAEAERLQAAFVAAGGSGDEPSDQLMFHPVRYCPVTDPFGTQIVVFAIRD